MTPSPKQRWSTPRKAVWWILAICLALLSVGYFVLTLYNLKVVGRLDLDPVFHTVICAVAALGCFKIKQHPEWLMDSEGRSRSWFTR